MNDFLVDKRHVRRAFNRAASGYDAIAVLQREVSGRMLERLDYIRQEPASVLDFGSGTGWGARQLLQRYPRAQLLALDMAINMLRVSRSKSSWWRKLFGGGKCSHICADVEALPLAGGSVDMAWSNLTLQWCNDLPATFAELYRVLNVDGLVMFSTFGPDTLKELRSAFHGVDEHRHVNRFADMHDIGDMLKGGGFAAPVMDMETITLTYDDVRSVMQDLRGIGAHNVTAGRGQGMMGKSAWRALHEGYERFREGGKLPATFEVIYGHAWKLRPRVLASGAQVIQTPFKL